MKVYFVKNFENQILCLTISQQDPFLQIMLKSQLAEIKTEQFANYPQFCSDSEGRLQLPLGLLLDQTLYAYGLTLWVLDHPWYQNSVTRFGNFPPWYERQPNQHLKTSTLIYIRQFLNLKFVIFQIQY